MRRQHKRYSVMYPQNSRPSGISRRALKWGENREVRRLTTPEPGGPGFTPLSVSNAPDKRRYRPADSFWEMKRRCASNLGRVLCLCGSLLPVLDGRVLEPATCALARRGPGLGRQARAWCLCTARPAADRTRPASPVPSHARLRIKHRTAACWGPRAWTLRTLKSNSPRRIVLKVATWTRANRCTLTGTAGAPRIAHINRRWPDFRQAPRPWPLVEGHVKAAISPSGRWWPCVFL